MNAILEYAEAHRLRVRDLHDGHPVPPFYHRGAKRKTRRVAEDAELAIVGRLGYVAQDAPGAIGWYFKTKNGLMLNSLLAKLAKITGTRIKQVGLDECAGSSELADLAAIVALIRPWTRRKVSGKSAGPTRHRLGRLALATRPAVRAGSTHWARPVGWYGGKQPAPKAYMFRTSAGVS
jgi:hypothetical protein